MRNLSKTQLEIVSNMKEGWILKSRKISTHAMVSSWIQKDASEYSDRKQISIQTFKSLLKINVISAKDKDDAITTYVLGDKWK